MPTNIKIGVDVDPNSKVIYFILLEIAAHLGLLLNKARPFIIDACYNFIGESIRNSPEYLAMLPGGDLYGQIGIPDIVDILEEIIEQIKKEMEVDIFPPQVTFNQVSITLEIRILEDSYRGLLGINGVSFDSKNGFQVNWLEWLLKEGTRKVVLGSKFINTRGITQSRTGQGLMTYSQDGWGFSGQYAGKPNNNWLTRALRDERRLAEIILLEIDKVVI